MSSWNSFVSKVGGIVELTHGIQYTWQTWDLKQVLTMSGKHLTLMSDR